MNSLKWKMLYSIHTGRILSLRFMNMNSKVNTVYSLAEDILTSDEVARLISELETLKEIKERQELNK